MPFAGQTRGEGHHVLFRDARVDEAFAVGLGNPLDGQVPDVAGDEHQIASRSAKSAIIVRANSSRIAGPRYGSRMRHRQLVESLLVLRVVHRQVVGSHGVLHVPNAVTLDGVGK